MRRAGERRHCGHACEHVFVVKSEALTDAVPESAENRAQYKERGWTTFEWKVGVGGRRRRRRRRTRSGKSVVSEESSGHRRQDSSEAVRCRVRSE